MSATIGPRFRLLGLYSIDELNNLISNEGYIPVASLSELANMPLNVTSSMGSGTEWAGDYITGRDKKYVQVNNLDGSSYGTWTPIFNYEASSFKGIYDGNELLISNVESDLQSAAEIQLSGMIGVNQGIFRNCRGDNLTFNSFTSRNSAPFIVRHKSGSILENVIISNCTNIVSSSVSSGGAGNMGCNIFAGRFDNCHVQNCSITVTPVAVTAGSFGNQATGGVIFTNCTVDADCVIYGTGGTDASGYGGFVGICNSASFTDCSSGGIVEFTGNSTTYGRNYGGFVGNVLTAPSTFTRCYSTARVEAYARVGGFVGGVRTEASFTECYSTGDVSASSTVSNGFAVGGFIGDTQGRLSTNPLSFTDCYSWSNVNNPYTNTSAFLAGARLATNLTFTNCYAIGSVVTPSAGNNTGISDLGTANDCYWNSDIIASTGSIGTGQTTSQLQTPVSPSGIYSNWSSSIWDFGTSSAYPELRMSDRINIDTTGIRLWLDFNNLNTLAQETVQGVGLVYDMSGNENNVTQSTDADKPKRTTSYFNGRDALEFDGLSEHLINYTDLGISSYPLTIYVAAQHDGALSNGHAVTLGDNGNSTVYYTVTLRDNLGSVPTAYYNPRNGGSPQVAYQLTGSEDDPYIVVGGSNDSTDHFVYQDLDTGGFQDTTTVNFNTATDITWIGRLRNSGTSQFFNGAIGEVLIYNVSHSTETRLEIQEYLYNKWKA